MFNIYNTLTRKKSRLPKAVAGKPLRLFVCGPTVYDFSHLGHARTYITFDIIVRALRARGNKLLYLQNITDLDDKIIDRAQKKKTSWKTIARTYERAYLADMAKLGIRSVNTYARASDHIPEIISQIRLLIQKKYAYITSTGIYFSVERARDYGKLSRQKPAQMKEAVRIDPDPTKKHFADFALWKFERPGEPAWPSPWGKGRPGWHIEDTAITHKIFGPQYELHGAAIDLIFPHHESEIALAESAFGKKPFVKVWMHAGFINVRGQKMAKSLGNFVTIREILEVWPPQVIRMAVARAHYRSPVDYDEDLLKDAAEALARIEEFIVRLGSAEPAPTSSGATAKIKYAHKAFWAFLEDDFHTPRALAAIFELIARLNPLLEKNMLTLREKKETARLLNEVDNVFGILPPKKPSQKVPAEIMKLVSLREKLRTQKKFQEADAVREQLLEEGWVIEDTGEGSRIKRAKTV